MEFKLLQPTSPEAFTPILFNHSELTKELTESLKKYEGLVYTEDTVKSAKADRATLNKFKEALESKRIEIKKQCMKPYEAFEKQVKELVVLVDKPILAIDGQIKSFENKQKELKREQVTTFFNENIGDLAELLPLTKIWNEKWLNASEKIKAIQTEITDTITKVKSDLDVITNLQSEFELQIKDTYLKTLNLSVALQEKTRLEEQKAKQEEYDRIQAEKKRQQEASKEITSPTVEPITETYLWKSPATPVAPEPVANADVEQPTQLDFRVWVTKEQLHALKQFLLDNNIKYGRVQ